MVPYVGVSNVGVVKRRSLKRLSGSNAVLGQTSQWVKRSIGSNVGVGQMQDFLDKRQSMYVSLECKTKGNM